LGKLVKSAPTFRPHSGGVCHVIKPLFDVNLGTGVVPACGEIH
jgi:hypothetical protein